MMMCRVLMFVDVCGRFSAAAVTQDILVTPFAQLLNSLRHIRSNIMILANIAPSRYNDTTLTYCIFSFHDYILRQQH